MSEKEMHKATCSECGSECEVPSNRTQTDQFTAANAGPKNDPQDHDDTKIVAH